MESSTSCCRSHCNLNLNLTLTHANVHGVNCICMRTCSFMSICMLQCQGVCGKCFKPTTLNHFNFRSLFWGWLFEHIRVISGQKAALLKLSFNALSKVKAKPCHLLQVCSSNRMPFIMVVSVSLSQRTKAFTESLDIWVKACALLSAWVERAFPKLNNYNNGAKSFPLKCHYVGFGDVFIWYHLRVILSLSIG